MHRCPWAPHATVGQGLQAPCRANSLGTPRAGPGALPSRCAWPRRPRVLRPWGPRPLRRQPAGATPRLRIGRSRAFAGGWVGGLCPRGRHSVARLSPSFPLFHVVSTAFSHHQKTRKGRGEILRGPPPVAFSFRVGSRLGSYRCPLFIGCHEEK